jgi:hypothetical protein
MIPNPCIEVQTSPLARPSVPGWFADELASIQTSSEPSLEPALAGEIRREPVHAEGERELATVVQVMLHHMPDDPGA